MIIGQEEIDEQKVVMELVENNGYAKLRTNSGKEITFRIKYAQQEAAGNWCI